MEPDDFDQEFERTVTELAPMAYLRFHGEPFCEAMPWEKSPYQKHWLDEVRKYLLDVSSRSKTYVPPGLQVPDKFAHPQSWEFRTSSNGLGAIKLLSWSQTRWWLVRPETCEILSRHGSQFEAVCAALARVGIVEQAS